jgi:quercetin 2,3-dioxygenase
MSTLRSIARILHGRPTVEGAGVRLRRVFGFSETDATDPFLLFDHFGSDRPEEYRAGFPWHPHRGMETVTYVLKGRVAHGDSLKNAGIIGAGDVQWMTAGSGILHQEMPEGDEDGRMDGFQLWVNLPAARKMTTPRYQEYGAADIPVVQAKDAVSVRVISGAFRGVRGPVTEVAGSPEYLDIRLLPNAPFEHSVPKNHTAFIYVFDGALHVVSDTESVVSTGNAALLTTGETLSVRAEVDGANFLLVSGTPLREPVAWRGPIVMNTQAELDLAFEELRTGRFIREKQA